MLLLYCLLRHKIPNFHEIVCKTARQRCHVTKGWRHTTARNLTEINEKNLQIIEMCFPIVRNTKCRLTRHKTLNRHRTETQPRYPTSIFTCRINLARKAVWNSTLTSWQESGVLKSEPQRQGSSFNTTAIEYLESLKSIHWPLFNRILCTNLEIVIRFFKHRITLIFWSAPAQASYYKVPTQKNRILIRHQLSNLVNSVVKGKVHIRGKQ